VIVANAGRDVTYVLFLLSHPFMQLQRSKEWRQEDRWLTKRELFRPIHPPNTLEKNLGPEQYKGVIDPVEAAKVCPPKLSSPLLCRPRNDRKLA